MFLKRGLKVLGGKGVTSVKKEMLQLHDCKIMEPKKPKELTREQRKEALDFLMFLKCKRCGRVKGCGCADGHKQRPYYHFSSNWKELCTILLALQREAKCPHIQCFQSTLFYFTDNEVSYHIVNSGSSCL